MSNKVTWDKIFIDFKSKYPRLAKEVRYFKPHDYLTIKVWLRGEPSVLLYDYLTKKCKFVYDSKN